MPPTRTSPTAIPARCLTKRPACIIIMPGTTTPRSADSPRPFAY